MAIDVHPKWSGCLVFGTSVYPSSDFLINCIRFFIRDPGVDHPVPDTTDFGVKLCLSIYTHEQSAEFINGQGLCCVR